MNGFVGVILCNGMGERRTNRFGANDDALNGSYNDPPIPALSRAQWKEKRKKKNQKCIISTPIRLKLDDIILVLI